MKGASILALITILLIISCKRKEIDYYPNGNVKMIAEVKKGKRDGVLKEFYPNGSIKSEGEWKDGVVNGKIYHYRIDSTIESVSNWLDGKLDGTTKHFYADGAIKSVSLYVQNVKIQTTIHYPNGTPKEYQLFNGHQHPVYIAAFDSLGDKTDEALLPIFESERDTIELGETYRVKISFGLPLPGRLKVYTGLYSSKTGLSDTTEISNEKGYVFDYSYTPEKSGVITVPFFFGYTPAPGDTLNVDGQLTKHTFFVIDNSSSS